MATRDLAGERGWDDLTGAFDAAEDGWAIACAIRDPAGEIVDFRLKYLNEPGARAIGRPREQLVGHPYREIWPDLAHDGQLAAYVGVVETGKPATLSFYYDGSARTGHFEVRARPFGDGLAVCYANISEVTARARQDRQIAASEAQARIVTGRIAALQSATAALARTVTVADVYAVMTEQVQPLDGWDSLLVMLLHDERMTISYSWGFSSFGQGFINGSALNDRHPLRRVIHDRVAAFYGDPDAYLAVYPERAEILDAVGCRAWALIPLLVAGRAIGAMALGYRDDRDFDGEREALISLGELYAQAIERARLYEAQRSIAADLQRALLPAELPALDGARHAACYLPWTEGAEVGGDWYDIIPLDGGAVGVAIGDVAGHSTSAAATMGQIRNALRAYALDGHSPTSVMERVNRLLLNVAPDTIVTCCYMELHLIEGTATAVLAGHVPPILVCGGAARPLDARLGPPLGVTADTRYLDTTMLLPPGCAVLLYTDGLVEDRRFRIDDGLAQLCGALADLPPGDPQALVDRVLGAGIGPYPRSDDVAMLAITVDERETSGPRVAARTFRGDAGSASSARRFAADLLVAWEAGALVDTARLLLGEVITNAVQHTVGDVQVRLALSADRLRVEVRDDSDRLPDPRAAEPDSESGRGLQIVASLADSWGHAAAADGRGGKVVWFELAT